VASQIAARKLDIAKYQDEYRAQLLELIDRKAAGEEIVAPAVSEAPTKVLDLVAALEASLARASDARGDADDEKAAETA